MVTAYEGIPRPLGMTAGCFVGAQPPLYFLAWIPALICESILCFLMLYKAWRMYRDQYESSLLRLIVRDRFVFQCYFCIQTDWWNLASVFYFLTYALKYLYGDQVVVKVVCRIFAVLLVNCLVWAFASQNFLEVALGWVNLRSSMELRTPTQWLQLGGCHPMRIGKSTPF